MTLSEYLKSYKEDYRLKVPIYLISSFSTGMVTTVLLLRMKTLLLLWWHVLLISLVMILSSVLIIFYLYIRYTYRENDFKFLLKKYEQDIRNGYMINKENNNFYCTDCLYNENHHEIKLSPRGEKWICSRQSCRAIFPKRYFGATELE